MGYLKIEGGVLTYNQYKDRVNCYKNIALQEFVDLYNAHKDK